MTAPFLVLEIVRVDSKRTEPIYRQIYNSIRTAILTGKMAKGDALPSTRELATQLGLSRMTVGSQWADIRFCLRQARADPRSNQADRGVLLMQSDPAGPVAAGT